MIQEDYVSFETAKLLKEKGFDWECKIMKFYPEPDYDQESPDGVSAPTLQMAMKWLREVHNLALNVCYLLGMWSYSVHRIDFSSSGFYSEDFDTYEEASEAGIRFCLEDLI